MRPLTIAILGSGQVAQSNHLPVWKKTREVRVVCICDSNEQLAEKTARRFGVPAVYSQLDQMLAQESLDCIDNCTPVHAHAKTSVQAIESGSHVIVEKPMSMYEAEAKQML